MNASLWPLWAAALALLLLALAGLLWPLLREPRAAAADAPADAAARQRLRELYRHKRAELEQETMAPAERQQALDELQRGLLQELDGARPSPALPTALRDGPWLRRMPAALLSVALPVAALTLYLQAGDPRAVAQLAATAAAMPPTHGGGASGQLETAIARLAERLRAEPADVEGWLVLARSQETLEHFEDAAHAYRQAISAATAQQAPAALVARLQADLADALASARQGDLAGPAQAAIDAALALDPRQPKALALAGAAALRRGDTADTRRHWQVLLALLEPGSDMALRVEADLQRLAQPAAPVVTTPGLRVRVAVDAAQAARMPAGATVFVIVRPAGQRMPAAVRRLPAAELPADVVVDDRHAMSPDRPLSGFDGVTVEARLSPSGQAMSQPGDWASEALPARRGQPGPALTIKPPARQASGA
jgi:cytochrome c-type biogenesis protein CcmH